MENFTTNTSLALTISITEEEEVARFIKETLGDTGINWGTLLPLTVIYTIFLVVGVCGNIATCIVIVNNEYMRTATNVYLLNLAITDIATLLLALPSELYLMWHQYPWVFGELACDTKIVITEAITYASILTIVAFTCERYLAICRPMSPLSRSSTGKAKKVIGMIWLISLLSASPWAFFTKVNYLTYKGRVLVESAWCSIPFNEESSGSLYMMMTSTLVYFVAPLVTVTVLYVRIALSLHHNIMKRCGACNGGNHCKVDKVYSKGKRVVIRMLVVVVIAFFFCWSPFHSQRLMFVLVTLYGKWNRMLTKAQHILFMTSGVCYYFNSILNPILYSLMSKRFRRAFMDIKKNMVSAQCCTRENSWDSMCGARPDIRDSDSGIDHSRSWHEQKLFHTQDYWRNNRNANKILPDAFARTYSDGQSPYAEFQEQPFPRAHSEGPQVKLHDLSPRRHKGAHVEIQGQMCKFYQHNQDNSALGRI